MTEIDEQESEMVEKLMVHDLEGAQLIVNWVKLNNPEATPNSDQLYTALSKINMLHDLGFVDDLDLIIKSRTAISRYMVGYVRHLGYEPITQYCWNEKITDLTRHLAQIITEEQYNKEFLAYLEDLPSTPKGEDPDVYAFNTLANWMLNYLGLDNRSDTGLTK